MVDPSGLDDVPPGYNDNGGYPNEISFGSREAQLLKRFNNFLSAWNGRDSIKNAVRASIRDNSIKIIEMDDVGNGGTPGEIRLNKNYTNDDLVYALFHEALHKAADAHHLGVPSFAWSIGLKFGDSMNPTNLDVVLQRADTTHGWIYWVTNQFYLGTTIPFQRNGVFADYASDTAKWSADHRSLVGRGSPSKPWEFRNYFQSLHTGGL